MLNDKLNRFLFAFFSLTVVGVLYSKYQEKNRLSDEEADYKKIKEYLLNESSIAKSKKPILWIHVPYEINARNWKSFGSRNSNDLNQPYLYLCLKSIIDKCGNDFNICLIDDDSFGKLVPDWIINMNKLPYNLQSYIRSIGLCKIIYYYGGLLLPVNTICFSSLLPVYNDIKQNNKPFFLEDRASSIYLSDEVRTFPSFEMVGCEKNNATMNFIINLLEENLSSDYTDETNFLGQNRRQLYKLTRNGQIHLIDGRTMGIKNDNNKEISIEMLMGETKIDLALKCYALIIPRKEVIIRNKYSWFVQLNIQQILESNFVLAKCFKNVS